MRGSDDTVRIHSLFHEDRIRLFAGGDVGPTWFVCEYANAARTAAASAARGDPGRDTASEAS